MHSLAKARRAKRYQSGALSLNTPKLSFKLDENGNPADFGSYPIRDSNRLVEVKCCAECSCICLLFFKPNGNEWPQTRIFVLRVALLDELVETL